MSNLTILLTFINFVIVFVALAITAINVAIYDYARAHPDTYPEDIRISLLPPRMCGPECEPDYDDPYLCSIHDRRAS